MSLVSTLPSPNQLRSSNSLASTTEVDNKDNLEQETKNLAVAEQDPEAALSSLLGAFTNDTTRSTSSMERAAPEYSQSDQSSAAHYNPDARSNANYSTTATPTSEYGVHPSSARSGSFPEHLQRQYYPASNHSGSSGSMAQPTNPSIAASSPSYPPQYGQQQHSPYGQPGAEMNHYAGHQAPMYAQPRPDWAGYGQPHPQHAPAGQQRPGQVYSFVPIPGAQQHKRPRRRYEEIERMYKCGWNGCEKAYGTLNHLNAHVTMQSHGQKRTPEEFKEIRKEWKARKKEEENARKADDERARQQAVVQGGPPDGQSADGAQPPPGYQQPGRSVQLPPIGYQPSGVAGQYSAPSSGVAQLQGYGEPGTHMYGGYPASPYGQQGQVYQHNGAPTKYEH